MAKCKVFKICSIAGCWIVGCRAFMWLECLISEDCQLFSPITKAGQNKDYHAD